MAGYVIITPAHDEAPFIKQAFRSMLRQTRPPARWIVVDDASSDETAALAEQCRDERPDLVEVIRLARPKGRSFAHKVRAFEAGRAHALRLDPDHIGNLDADITLSPDYYARVLAAFEADPRLGIAGGMVASRIGERFVRQQVALDSVAGAVQLFRRACYEAIGGYRALPQGGIDAAAEIAARHAGWRVRTLPELQVLEHRRTGTADAVPLAARWREGRRLHALGYGPAFFVGRCLRRALERPRIVGSLVALAGYAQAALRHDPIALPPAVVAFLRDEQRAKLRRLLLGSSGSGSR